MRFKSLILAAALAASSFLIPRMAQLSMNTPHPDPLTFRRVEGEQSSSFGVAHAADYSVASISPLQFDQRRKVQWPPRGLTERVQTGFPATAYREEVKSFSRELPKPGVYRTTPFACIVIVPPSDFDGQIAVSPPESACPMPLLKPDLHFIPLNSK